MRVLAPHLRATAALALPLIGSNLAQTAISVTDTFMVGWYGAAELAAVTLGATLFFTLFIVGSGFSLAVMPMVAAAAAQNDRRQVRRVTRMGLWLSVMFSLLVLPIFFVSETLLLALGQAPETARLAATYLQIAGPGMIFAVMAMALKSHLAALEHTQIALWATLSAALLNAALNWVLIFGRFGFPEMGIRGAAIASLGTHAVSFFILALYAARARGVADFDIFARIWWPDWEAFGQVFRLGWPIGSTSLAESGLFTAATVMIGWIGTIELAAHGVAVQIASATFMIHVGLSSAATVRTGQAHGRRDVLALRQGAGAALILSAAMAGLTVALYLGLPEALIGVFLDTDDPARAAIIAIGVGFLAMAALFQLVDAAQVMALGLLRGVQDTRVPMIYAIVSYWGIGVPASYVLAFPLGWGGQGVWFGLAVGLACAAVSMMLRFWRSPAVHPASASP